MGDLMIKEGQAARPTTGTVTITSSGAPATSVVPIPVPVPVAPATRLVAPPGPPEPGWSPSPAPAGGQRRGGAALIGCVVLLGLLAGVWFVLVRTPEPKPDQRPDGGDTSSGQAESADLLPPGPVTASASCVAPPSRDAAGNPVGYDPGNAVDGRSDTAWRCDGSGIGQYITVDLGRRRAISSIGLVVGYAKTDPTDGTDRYQQNRRVSAVRLSFDDGSSRDATLDAGPYSRSIQQQSFATVTTRTVRVTILDSVPGQQVGLQPAMDKVAISEIEVGATG